MNKFTKVCRSVLLAPRNAFRKVRYLWQHGPISREEAERVDRICNPSKYRPLAAAPAVEQSVDNGLS